ncbi:hypothetical protein D3C87_1713920 [compost metagenome]
MLATIGFTFHGDFLFSNGACAVAEGFLIERAERCPHFYAAVGLNIAVQHVDAVYRAFIAVNHHRQLVVFQRFKVTDNIAIFRFHPAAQAVITA